MYYYMYLSEVGIEQDASQPTTYIFDSGSGTAKSITNFEGSMYRLILQTIPGEDAFYAKIYKIATNRICQVDIVRKNT